MKLSTIDKITSWARNVKYREEIPKATLDQGYSHPSIFFPAILTVIDLLEYLLAWSEETRVARVVVENDNMFCAALNVQRSSVKKGIRKAALAVEEATRIWLQQSRDDSLYTMLALGHVGQILHIVAANLGTPEQAKKWSLDLSKTLKKGYKMDELAPCPAIDQSCQIPSIRTGREQKGTQGGSVAQSEQDDRRALPEHVLIRTTGFKKRPYEASHEPEDLPAPQAKKVCHSSGATPRRPSARFDVYNADVDRALMQ